MMTSDPIADMLTRIRNALTARHPKVDVPASQAEDGDRAHPARKRATSSTSSWPRKASRRRFKIYLKYTPGNEPVISRIERVSRPGCRVYVGSKEVPRVLGGLGINILTTPKGVMTGRTARKKRAWAARSSARSGRRGKG